MNSKRPTGPALLGLGLSILLLGGCGVTSPAPTTSTTTPVVSIYQSAASPTTVAQAQPVSPTAPPPITVVAVSFTAGTATNPTPSTAVSGTATVLPTEPPVAPEQNPPGDIPDTQAFVKYSSATGGYELQAPEGWARTERDSDVSFSDKLDGAIVAVTSATAAPSAKDATQIAAALTRSGRAVQMGQIKDVNLAGGPAVMIEYSSNSDPNPVTGKQVRLENNRYLFWQAGRLATITLYAPLGSDNVDQWKLMVESFRWTK